jgi:hypothetical protein
MDGTHIPPHVSGEPALPARAGSPRTYSWSAISICSSASFYLDGKALRTICESSAMLQVSQDLGLLRGSTSSAMRAIPSPVTLLHLSCRSLTGVHFGYKYDYFTPK